MLLLNQIEKKILYELSKGIALYRDILAKNINIPRTTIYDNLEKLKEKHYVYNYSIHKNNVGRPKVYWYIYPKILKIIRNKNFFNIK